MLTVAIPKRNKLQNIIVLTPKDGEKVEGLMAARGPVYEKAADITVNTDGRTPGEIAREIAAFAKSS